MINYDIKLWLKGIIIIALSPIILTYKILHFAIIIIPIAIAELWNNSKEGNNHP